MALKYDKSKGPPRVVAKGQDELAERIINIARMHNVPEIKDPKLLKDLYKVNVGDDIPVGLYEAVAKIIARIYLLKGKKGTDQ
ncbi:EscU/YscU/HrcU family type III secretion system export apparatus switch protein [Thermodesulfobium narugense]|uniref:EscU/YscU/HrcU family type III secretion system export apparatus switch protein n=1 Tax=Thermodesulfobium narugense TaxID=184064 RepID=UPI00031FA5AD|nr:EscU/YscU/HrcU family type III secretion system export apparatus switch protein [Thermodesulfobium narugense]